MEKVKYGIALMLLTAGLAVALDNGNQTTTTYDNNPTTINLSNINQDLYNSMANMTGFDSSNLLSEDSNTTNNIANQQTNIWQLGSPTGLKNMLKGIVDDWLNLNPNQNQNQSQNQNQ